MNPPRLVFRVHAVQRMFERNVSVRNVSQALQSGETIEDYSEEMPEPSQLILGFQGKRPFHTVVSRIPETDAVMIVTVYLPDPKKWSRDFKRRRA